VDDSTITTKVKAELLADCDYWFCVRLECTCSA
jgi:hypothetical protein